MVNLEHVRLDNGLNVYLLNDNSKHTTYINLIVKYGGMDNTYYINNKKIVNKNGMAHLIEHLVLENNVNGDLMSYFGNIGARSNGITSIDKTVYYVDTVVNTLECIDKLIYGIHNPIIDDNILNNVKMPIIEEKRRSLDNKYSVLYNKSIDSIKDNKKYTSVLGDIKEISSITINQIKVAFKAFYRPDNEIVVISGKFDKNEVLNKLEEVYSKLSFDTSVVTKYKYPHNIKVNEKKYKVKTNTGVGRVLITFKLNTINYSGLDKLKLDLYIYSFLRMNFGIISNLNKELIDNNIINSGIGYSNLLLEGYHIINIEGNTNKYNDFIDRILMFINDKEYILDEELFNLYKRNYIVDLIIRNDSIYDITEPFIENVITYNYDKLDSISEYEKLNFNEFINYINCLNFTEYSIGILED